jgi:outer membrane lipoprotein SlyB
MTTLVLNPRLSRGLLVLGAALVLAACSTTNPDVIQRGDAQRLSQIQDATVLAVRDVVVEGNQSGIGAAAGGAVGGIAGGSVGGRREGAAVGVLGAVAGAVVGNAVERFGNREQAVEIVLQLRNGERRAIVQGKGGEVLAAGDQVVVVTNGGRSRVMKTPPVGPSPQAAPAAPAPQS